ncbi:MAG: methylated-DNA--[protein]-cysteine S-methyltransferase [Candidatus Cloacimonadota bacterium]|nr:methylated-DNA--[protein]-cysteine S-methyltransferase [Candidatus Cloacimonadota bacterium]
MDTIYKSKLHSFIGNIFLLFNKNGLLNVSINCYNDKWVDKFFPNAFIKSLNNNIYLTQLKEYFAGLRKEFEFPTLLFGTKFQKEVWEFVYKIPFGKTMSYLEVAKNIKRKTAQRAVGNALGNNPLLIVIPCHRVIKLDGSLGGFSAGIEIKKQLLTLEKENLK